MLPFLSSPVLYVSQTVGDKIQMLGKYYQLFWGRNI